MVLAFRLQFEEKTGPTGFWIRIDQVDLIFGDEPGGETRIYRHSLNLQTFQMKKVTNKIVLN